MSWHDEDNDNLSCLINMNIHMHILINLQNFEMSVRIVSHILNISKS